MNIGNIQISTTGSGKNTCFFFRTIVSSFTDDSQVPNQGFFTLGENKSLEKGIDQILGGSHNLSPRDRNDLEELGKICREEDGNLAAVRKRLIDREA
jgi:hypothetical protein